MDMVESDISSVIRRMYIIYRILIIYIWKWAQIRRCIKCLNYTQLLGGNILVTIVLVTICNCSIYWVTFIFGKFENSFFEILDMIF